MLNTALLLGFVAASVVVLVTSGRAFNAVRFLGAAYLIWLGLRALFGRAKPAGTMTATPRALGRLFRDGLIYAGLALVTDGAYAVFAGGLRRWLAGPVASGPWPRRLSGGVFLGLGVYTALAGLRTRT